MLYLARKVGQSIIIDNRIEVTITEVKGHTVKLGFVFPADVSVLRKEVYDKISAENQAATATEGDYTIYLDQGPADEE